MKKKVIKSEYKGETLEMNQKGKKYMKEEKLRVNFREKSKK